MRSSPPSIRAGIRCRTPDAVAPEAGKTNRIRTRRPIYQDQVEQKDRLICIEKAFIDEQGEPLFDAQSQPSAKWSEIERLLSEYEADLERSREMCAILGDYGLLEPFTMQATLNKDKGGGA
ncbi:MAG: SapC family protein, partial [Betaproteobacteria bacterium]